jgi:hypothetical protein
MCRIVADAVIEGRWLYERKHSRAGARADNGAPAAPKEEPRVLDPEEQRRREEAQQEARNQAAAAQRAREERQAAAKEDGTETAEADAATGADEAPTETGAASA